MKIILEKISNAITNYLSKPLIGYEPPSLTPLEQLKQTLQPGDLLLVEGRERISAAIKYLTQSTWSHASMCVRKESAEQRCTLVEADLQRGVVAVELQKYACYHTRICRPIGLSQSDTDAVTGFLMDRIGLTYDLKNVVDLMRYLIPLPIPTRHRKMMLALGSGDPTRVICSTLIAQAYQSIRYPILPYYEHHDEADISHAQRLRIRHHSLFTPRDFDLSPFFAIIKPTLEQGFEYKRLNWSDLSPASLE